ncbi:ABC transporter ATP-binding protein [Candidatus Giovannonibacteria bacterium]|nr:ABC transporter ATP-binding protein [Candidatus Giovannonibacteria bacterium]
MPLIEVKNLKKTYYTDDLEIPVLRGLSFSIETGEFVAVMGPSGSGKSTLLHILGFLDRHTSGDYFFDGKTFDDYGMSEIARVRNEKMGFVFQAFNLLGRSSVLENVKLPLLYSRIPEAEWNGIAEGAIQAVGLMHRKDQEASRLSGGEKQRAAIARALVTNPQIIFADEPTGNLDSKSGELVMETIRKLNEEENKTVVLITHETYTARHAERILHILDGKIESDEKVEHRHVPNKFFK